MKAYLIDPKEKKITEVNYGGDWRTISQHCGCNTLDMVRLNDQHDSVYVDDEGLLNGAAERDGVFMLTFASPVGEPRCVPLAGKGLVLGHDSQGFNADCRMSLAELQAMVRFQVARVHDERMF